MKKIFLLFLLAAQPVWADWQLDNTNSKLSFMSIKAGSAAEIHTFKNLSGIVDAEGQATLTIELVSVDTKIPLRDERMKNVLFKTAEHPHASLKTKIDLTLIDTLQAGKTTMQNVDATLELHGETDTVSGKVIISRLNKNTLQVKNLDLFVVDVRSFGLLAGLKELQKLAGLPSISSAVPISFILTFTQK